MLHLDYHQPPWMHSYAEAIDAEAARRQARMFKEAGIQAVELFAYDHHGQAFYPSAVGVVHPALTVDYTGLMSQALKAEGLKVILYLNVFTSVHLFKQHPDWFVRRADGTHPKGAWLDFEASLICASSPYVEAYFVPLIQEAVSRHTPDAVWLDALSWMVETPCTCENCQRIFNQATGYDLPTGPMPAPAEELDHPVWLAWRLWRRGQIYETLAKIYAAVKAINPSVLVTDNNLGRFSTGIPIVEGIEGRRVVKWPTPSQLPLDYLSCDPVPMGGNHEMVLSVEGRYQWTTGLPFNYINERFHAWGEWQFRSPVDWSLEFANVVANGGRCFFAEQPYSEGTLEPEVFRQLKPLYERIAAIEPYLINAQPVGDVAILASLASTALGPQGGVVWGRRSTAANNDAVMGGRADRVRGAHLACVEGGLQALIYDEATLLAKLAEQNAVVLPEQCLLEDDTLAALKDYVREGGRLFVTGCSGWWNESGQRRTHDPLAELLGMQREGTLPAPIHYLRGVSEPNGWQAGLAGLPLQMWGAAVHAIPTTAEPLAWLFEPRADVWQEGIRNKAHWRAHTVFGAMPPGNKMAGPAVTLNHYGRGLVLYSAIDPFALYFQEGHRLMREFILAAMERLLPNTARRLWVKKPLQVEVVLAEQPGRLLVHVLNYAAQKRVGALTHTECLIPVRDIEISLRAEAAPARVYLAPSNTEQPNALAFTFSDGFIRLVLPELDVHAVIVVERA
jgi:hypothetical protein